jgi:hypothetical protein
VTELKKGAKITVNEELLKEEGKKGEAPGVTGQPGKAESPGKAGETPVKAEPAPGKEAAPKK